jgi:hypothetical protein
LAEHATTAGGGDAGDDVAELVGDGLAGATELALLEGEGDSDGEGACAVGLAEQQAVTTKTKQASSAFPFIKAGNGSWKFGVMELDGIIFWS